MTDPSDCIAREVADLYIQGLEDEIEAKATAEGLLTDDIAHLWRHLVEAATLRLIRLSPELVKRMREAHD